MSMSFGLGFEVQDHAVPQRRQIDAAHVFEADVVAAFEQRPHLGGQRQRLRAARAAPQRRYWLVIGRANGPSGCVASISRTM